MATNPSNQKRIFIWQTQRSLSTVFTRSLSQIPDSCAILAHFCSAAKFGPERKYLQDYEYEYAGTDTFESMKAIYEQPRPGKSVVIGKDCSHYLAEKYDFIPKGYQHVFLIRHPLKSISSMAARIKTLPEKQVYHFKVNQYKYLHNLHQYLKTTHGINASVLDADDLIAQPKEMLQKFCKILGLPFSDKLLTWDWTDEKPDNWMVRNSLWEDHKIHGWYDNCLHSTGFRKPTDAAKTDKKALEPEFVKMVEEALPYYEEIRKLRIKPGF
ncbi:uncharacterized protein LOC117291687 [Asterias rubens]|uniref:uncharacterized protein LOC117291687 n=1 Tax=Asterias rubens TaxID=7604 RepID=UPI0014554846|nr:uncharacterized protein LOC117291687 [Asterias rubens]